MLEVPGFVALLCVLAFQGIVGPEVHVPWNRLDHMREMQLHSVLRGSKSWSSSDAASKKFHLGREYSAGVGVKVKFPSLCPSRWKAHRSPGSPSRGHSIRQLGNSLAGLNVAVVQAQGEKLLKASIDLLMHGSVLWGDFAQFLKQTLTALVVVAFCVLQALAMLRGCLGCLDGSSLGMDRAGALHRRRWGDAWNSPLAGGGFLLSG